MQGRASDIWCFLREAKRTPLVTWARQRELDDGWAVRHEDHKGPPTTANGPPGTGHPSHVAEPQMYTVGPWTSHGPTLGLSFPICLMGDWARSPLSAAVRGGNSLVSRIFLDGFRVGCDLGGHICPLIFLERMLSSLLFCSQPTVEQLRCLAFPLFLLSPPAHLTWAGEGGREGPAR